MELQLVREYGARPWDGVVVPLGEGDLEAIRDLGKRNSPRSAPQGGLLEKRVRSTGFPPLQREG